MFAGATKMLVVKRDGSKQEVKLDAITERIRALTDGLDLRFIDPVPVAMKVVQGLHNGVTTRELDQLAAEICAYSSTYHPDWSILAARIAVSNLHKETEASFSKNCAVLHSYRHPKTGLPAALLADDVYEIIQANAARFDAAIDYKRDYDFDYFGFKTLERSYLLKVGNAIGERPQQMYMRVSIGIHKHDVDAAIQTYELMSKRYFTHATPTLFNGGTPRPQLSSCFLLMMKEDSISGIYDTLKNCACISKFAGGIGLSIHNVRATNSYIRGTNGESNGIVPMLRVFSDTARYVDQGGGKRKGGFAIYLEPWHADIFEFIDLKKNTGKEEMRARDLFYALWIPDLFMQRVESNGKWSLFCPNEAPGLADVVGEEFKALYERYEAEGRQRREVNAQELWFYILDAQVETGNPYMLYKDACNLKSNQQHLGVIKSSNLCTEIVEYTAPDEIAVCNLASVALNMFVNTAEKTYDFAHLVEITKVMTYNLNKVIDVNFYPVEEARRSNMRHRPIGIGVQGLADTFALLRMPFDSPEAAALNKEIFEAIYFGAVWASTELAEKNGTYETYPGSPASKGILQPDMWNVTPSARFDWPALRARVARFGLRNSLLMAPMPTASTAQILGNNESIEPFTSNMYSRRVLAGDFAMVNRHLMRDLIDLGIWNESVRNHIIADQGSIQKIPAIPSYIKDLYKTVWEIKQRSLIDMSADRGAFICQSQSLNLFIAAPDRKTLTSMHFYGWKKGLKTGMYYLRTKPKADAIQFTVDQALLAESRAGATYEENAIALASLAAAGPVVHVEAAKNKVAEALDFEGAALSSSTPAGSSPGKDAPTTSSKTPADGAAAAIPPAGGSPSAEAADKAARRAAQAEEMAAIKARMRAGIFTDLGAATEGCEGCGS